MDQPADLLTARELQVLSLVADGLSNKKVASKLLIGEPTVKAHLVRVFDKLGVKGRTAAVMAALERGLLRH
nr:LuxR C-terminal-related transcriptional regulator [Deinococcus sp. Arct2-2]